MAARVLWVVIVAVEVAVFTICAVPSGTTCNFTQLTSDKLQALEQSGATIGAYATYTFAIHVAASLLFFVVGALIFWHRSGDWYGIFVSLLLITFGTIGVSSVFADALGWAHPESRRSFLRQRR